MATSPWSARSWRRLDHLVRSYRCWRRTGLEQPPSGPIPGPWSFRVPALPGHRMVDGLVAGLLVGRRPDHDTSGARRNGRDCRRLLANLAHGWRVAAAQPGLGADRRDARRSGSVDLGRRYPILTAPGATAMTKILVL